MAGAGYKAFADGDVLTAAQVQTFLQDQAVMRFADASARTTGLGGAVAEGMVSYLQDTDSVEVYDGSAWVGVGAPGIGTNVASATKADQFTTTSSSVVGVTGLSVSITPTRDTHKVLIIAQIGGAWNAGVFGWEVHLRRNSTDIFQSTGGSGTNGTITGNFGSAASSTQTVKSMTIAYLDSPATSSAVTYDIGVATGGGTLYVNTSTSGFYGQASSITAIEVSA